MAFLGLAPRMWFSGTTDLPCARPSYYTPRTETLMEAVVVAILSVIGTLVGLMGGAIGILWRDIGTLRTRLDNTQTRLDTTVRNLGVALRDLAASKKNHNDCEERSARMAVELAELKRRFDTQDGSQL